ncbi:hypothetical protein CYY_001294 [Polysphondylium violaceum]|uniref:Uncharacterized protein n=1 Tax=Polysphondylium violaceum TaxID=133409 RepID=A0A8J4Q9I3_9MYCE|nr:hypothetical protein CYY_001294 [Polysphondylium violaceum]
MMINSNHLTSICRLNSRSVLSLFQSSFILPPSSSFSLVKQHQNLNQRKRFFCTATTTSTTTTTTSNSTISTIKNNDNKIIDNDIEKLIQNAKTNSNNLESFLAFSNIIKELGSNINSKNYSLLLESCLGLIYKYQLYLNNAYKKDPHSLLANLKDNTSGGFEFQSPSIITNQSIIDYSQYLLDRMSKLHINSNNNNKNNSNEHPFIHCQTILKLLNDTLIFYNQQQQQQSSNNSNNQSNNNKLIKLHKELKEIENIFDQIQYKYDKEVEKVLELIQTRYHYEATSKAVPLLQHANNSNLLNLLLENLVLYGNSSFGLLILESYKENFHGIEKDQDGNPLPSDEKLLADLIVFSILSKNSAKVGKYAHQLSAIDPTFTQEKLNLLLSHQDEVFYSLNFYTMKNDPRRHIPTLEKLFDNPLDKKDHIIAQLVLCDLYSIEKRFDKLITQHYFRDTLNFMKNHLDHLEKLNGLLSHFQQSYSIEDILYSILEKKKDLFIEKKLLTEGIEYHFELFYLLKYCIPFADPIKMNHLLSNLLNGSAKLLYTKGKYKNSLDVFKKSLKLFAYSNNLPYQMIMWNNLFLQSQQYSQGIKMIKLMNEKSTSFPWMELMTSREKIEYHSLSFQICFKEIESLFRQNRKNLVSICSELSDSGIVSWDSKKMFNFNTSKVSELIHDVVYMEQVVAKLIHELKPADPLVLHDVLSLMSLAIQQFLKFIKELNSTSDTLLEKQRKSLQELGVLVDDLLL